MVVVDAPNRVKFQVCQVFPAPPHALPSARTIVVLVFQLLWVVELFQMFRIKISVDQLLSVGLHQLVEGHQRSGVLNKTVRQFRKPPDLILMAKDFRRLREGYIRESGDYTYRTCV